MSMVGLSLGLIVVGGGASFYLWPGILGGGDRALPAPKASTPRRSPADSAPPSVSDIRFGRSKRSTNDFGRR